MKKGRSQVVNEVLKYVKERFGIEESVFDGYELVEMGDVWIATKEVATFKSKAVKRRGLRFARVYKKGFKLTTAAMQIFGKYATKNVITLKNLKEAEAFIGGRDLRIELPGVVTDGQVIVKFNGDILGSGLLKGDVLKNQIPKGRRIPLKS